MNNLIICTNNASTSDNGIINIALSINVDNDQLFRMQQQSNHLFNSSLAEEDEKDDVTHGVFFGENIRRALKAFSSNSNG